jgi:hypothetical protein
LYARGKQVWLFAGLLPIGRTSVATPPDGNCLVVTKFTFGDVLISGVTLGLITTYTIKVRAKDAHRNAGYSQAPPPQTNSSVTANPNQSQTYNSNQSRTATSNQNRSYEADNDVYDELHDQGMGNTPAPPAFGNSTRAAQKSDEGAMAYMKNKIGNSLLVKIEHINGMDAYVMYENVFGKKVSKKVHLSELQVLVN